MKHVRGIARIRPVIAVGTVALSLGILGLTGVLGADGGVKTMNRQSESGSFLFKISEAPSEERMEVFLEEPFVFRHTLTFRYFRVKDVLKFQPSVSRSKWKWSGRFGIEAVQLSELGIPRPKPGDLVRTVDFRDLNQSYFEANPANATKTLGKATARGKHDALSGPLTKGGVLRCDRYDLNFGAFVCGE